MIRIDLKSAIIHALYYRWSKRCRQMPPIVALLSGADPPDVEKQHESGGLDLQGFAID